MISERENYLRAIEFRYPEWIPCRVDFSYAFWRKHREELEKIVVSHPLIFRDSACVRIEDQRKGSYDLPPVYREGEYFRDNWGCLWYNTKEGYEGRVVENPLSNWEALDTYQPPDFLTKTERGERDWEKIKRDIEEQRKKGLLIKGDGERLFDRLYFLRGFKNLMIDITTDDPHLPKLINMLLDYEMKLVKKWLDIGVDIMGFHTDIGTQNGLMISPLKFRKYIKPMLKKLFMTCRNANTHVYLSSDGRLVDLVNEFIECGISNQQVQLGANTLKDVEKAYKGKLCIELDLNRQMFPFCKPEDIKKHVKEAVERLYLQEGGLMVWGWLTDDVPLKNVNALCEALEQFCLNIE